MMNPDSMPQRRPPRRRAWAVLATIAVVLMLGWLWRSMHPPLPAGRLLRDARKALATGDYDAADALCRRALQQKPDDVPALLLAGEAAMRTERFEDALHFFRKVPRTNSDESIAATLSAAEVSRATGRLAAAERDYRDVIVRRPRHVVAHERLAFILDLQGRRWESIPHLLEQLRQDQISFSCLIRLGSRDSAVPFPEELERIRRADHDPAAVKLAEAVNALASLQFDDAEELLREAIRIQPELMEAHARLGRLLADRDISQIPAWHSQLPRRAETHPDIGVACGLWCVHDGQTRAAVRCFREAAAIDPNHRVAQYQLGQLLSGPEFIDLPGCAEAAPRFAERSRLLQRLAANMSQLLLNRGDIAAMQSASVLLEELGRYWEAYGWCGMVLFTDSRQDQTRDRMQELSRRLSPSLPLTDPRTNPAEHLDVSVFPKPVWPSGNTRTTTDQPSTGGGTVVFADRAVAAGLDFTYFHGRKTVSPGTKMYEFAGGGVGVLDYDSDGLTDLYFTQGCPWPPRSESAEYRDRLFRNTGDGRFQDVTEAAGLGDGWFSQGVAVGDINDDGCPDLYVANIGRNRLYRNNGDGTFREIADRAGVRGEQWTISCLLADLDGDRFADIYDVNYLKGEDLFDRLCLVEGQRRACVPSVFDAEKDRIQLSQGDERFRELTGTQAAPLEPPRAGMGIVAADMDGSGRLSLFVANDVVANAFLMNETATGEPLALQENALLAGLAFDRDGQAQACMGVAAEDLDGNGLLDFCVTNYYEEANSLYLQMAPGRFVESSRPAGLYDSSLLELGFGTQFLDANLDGLPDLVVANGHLDDFRYLNIPYRMRPQLFISRAAGQLQEALTPGPWFERDLLARSIAVLDWNHDGRPDFAVSHLESPVALLTNETQQHGHWLKLRLYGVTSARDAIGASVSVQCGAHTWTRQLTAGSGYQASNERMLLFGIGDCTRIDSLSIRWPSGTQQSFANVLPDQELAVTENTDSLYQIPSGK